MSTTKILTTALVISAAATAPAASAHPADVGPVNAQPKSVQIVQSPAADNGFDWGDAGIGAGGVVALTLLSLGGVAGARRATRHTMSPAG